MNRFGAIFLVDAAISARLNELLQQTAVSEKEAPETEASKTAVDDERVKQCPNTDPSALTCG